MLLTMASTNVNPTFKKCFVSFILLSPVVFMNFSRLIQLTHPIDHGVDWMCRLFKRLQIGDAVSIHNCTTEFQGETASLLPLQRGKLRANLRFLSGQTSRDDLWGPRWSIVQVLWADLWKPCSSGKHNWSHCSSPPSKETQIWHYFFWRHYRCLSVHEVRWNMLPIFQTVLRKTEL